MAVRFFVILFQQPDYEAKNKTALSFWHSMAAFQGLRLVFMISYE